MEKIIKWLNDNPKGYGYGDGYGYGSGYGDGSGDGSGYGYGSGYGDGSGYGYGYGDGSGYGIKFFNGKAVFMVDGVQTIIEHIKESFAHGYILNGDLTLTPCFVAKGQGYFAHGKTLREAREALTDKIFENMDSDEAIENFLHEFEINKKYPGTKFFEWHHYLTGSCLMGREAFVSNNDLDINADYSVKEFIELCENDYGADVIKQLKERIYGGLI